MYQFVYPFIHIANHNTSRNPKKTWDKDNRENDIISEKFEQPVNIYVFNDIPESLNYIMYRSLTLPLKKFKKIY